MNETNINKLNSRLETLEKLCHNLHSDLFQLKINQETKAKTKEIRKLIIGDKIILPIYRKKRVLTINSIECFNSYQYLLGFKECTQREVYSGDKIVVLCED